VDAFKTDFWRAHPTDVVYYEWLRSVGRCTLFHLSVQQNCFQIVEEVRGKAKRWSLPRSATAGRQQFPVHWGGDKHGQPSKSMAESLRGGLFAGLSGFGFWSHDIGAFEQIFGRL